MTERVDLDRRSLRWADGRTGARSRLSPRCGRSRCSSRRARASLRRAKKPKSPSRTPGTKPQAGELLQLARGAGRDWSLEGPLQPHPAALLPWLPTTCARHPAGDRTPATHTSHYAVVSLNPVQNPGQVRSWPTEATPGLYREHQRGWAAAPAHFGYGGTRPSSLLSLGLQQPQHGREAQPR